MAPSVWDSTDFVDGGLKSIVRFRGKLRETEEDVEGEYGAQVALHFYDVEILEAGDDVHLEEGLYTDWIKQSVKKNSVNHRMIGKWEEAALELDIKWAGAKTFVDRDLVWERQVVWEPNSDDMSPGKALIPISLGDAAKASTDKRTTPSEETTEGNDDISDELVEFITQATGDGLTGALIKRAVTKKVKMKNAMVKAGGLDTVIEYMVENDLLVEDDGTYAVLVA